MTRRFKKSAYLSLRCLGINAAMRSSVSKDELSATLTNMVGCSQVTWFSMNLARPDLYNQWFDFYFPGQDRFTIWNAEIVTARKAFWDAAHELAYQCTTAMLTPEEHAAESNIEFEPADFSSTGKVLSYKLIERKKMQYEKFSGLTFYEQWEKLESEIVRETPPTIHESFRLDRSYAYGIGLFIILDVNVIDRAAIEQAITKFRLISETDWHAAIPVPRERLPVVSEKEALAAI